MPTVLHVLATAGRRGAEVFALDLAAALEPLGWASTLVAVRRAGHELPVEVASSPRVLRIRRMARRADVVLAHGSVSLPVSALATAAVPFAPRRRPPFVYRSIGDPHAWAATPLRRARVGFALRRASAVVALWPAAEHVLTARYRLDPSRVTSIPNAVSDRFTPVTADERARARQRFQVPADAPVVAVVGALSPEKDVATALAASAAVAGVRVLIAGSGPERAALEEHASRLGVDARFLGNVPDPETVLAAADVLVLTSRTEGVPGALLEAGARGVPVVATDVGAVSTIVTEDAGVVVPAGDVAAAAEAVRIVLGRSGKGARPWLPERYRMPEVVAAWDATLRAVAEGRPLQPGGQSIP